MPGKSFFLNSSKLFIAVPIVLLILSLGLSNNDIALNNDEFEVNSYLKEIPEKYRELIDFKHLNDSSFFVKVIDKPLSRELVIFKLFPTTQNIKTRFDIEVFPDDNQKKTAPAKLNFEVRSEASKFNYSIMSFAVFRQAIPLINIKNITVKELSFNPKAKVWQTQIEAPFSEISTEIKALNPLETGTISEMPGVYDKIVENVLEHYQIPYAAYNYAIKNDSLVQVKRKVSELVNDRTLVTISSPITFWNKINRKDKSVVKNFKVIGENKDKINDLILNLIDKDAPLKSLFDIEKLATFSAVKNCFSMHCNEPMYLLFNEQTNVLEPYFYSSKCTGGLSKYIPKSKLNDKEYSKAYALALEDISSLNMFALIENNSDSITKEIELINAYYPNSLFDLDVLLLNQRVINKNLNPSIALKAEILLVNDQHMQIVVENLTQHPIQVKSLEFDKKKNIARLNPAKELFKGEKDTITIDLPRSFENLFVNKKKKTTGFRLFKDIYDLSIGYSISGIDKMQFAPIIPYETRQVVSEDLFRTTTTIFENKDFDVNKTTKTITLTNSETTIGTPLIIPEGYVFKLSPGETIDIVDKGKIISYASFEFQGTKDKPVKIHSSDQKGQGIIVISANQKSILNHVVFDHLTNPKNETWNVTGALTFYESSVALDHVVISNNTCEDALNIIRTEFTMNNTLISNTQSDAFDGDFVKGTITDSQFVNLGNDGIDVSGSALDIKNVTITKAGDKGLSAGEDSSMNIEKVTIKDSEIAIAGKDLSTIKARLVTISGTKLGFTAFQKKSEFGPSNIKVNGITMTNVETDYLIEQSSTLIVDGKRIETSLNVLDRMYGAEFGRSSAETKGN